MRRLLQLQLTRRRPRLLRWWSLFFSRFSKMRMNEFFYRKERERCVCVCVCVCVSNARARDYNFEEEIDLLFFEHSRFRRIDDDFQERETKKYAKEKKDKKKQTPFSSNKNATDDVETTTVASSSSLPVLVLFPPPRFFPFSSIAFKRAGRGGKMSSGHCENRSERVRKRLWKRRRSRYPVLFLYIFSYMFKLPSQSYARNASRFSVKRS